ncbi:4Fe-4S binding protein [Desulfosporosinus sp. BG]|uniref:4Fe-4S binding protein n=1 Tax=Desulfosporosinus sp. BG TaxID=1633135 RepID=UPI0009F6E995|nr:4Fe-4S binding protein [Desulfosporosinus sp. BG]
MIISVDQNRCPQNHSCPAIQVCSVFAIRQYGFDAPKIDQEKCTKCKKCVKYCPMGALQVI